jgi:hypothetical protein
LSKSLCPRLSEARHLLPILRSHLIAAASSYPLPIGMVVELLPIVDNGVFGYELVPNRKTHTFVTVGADSQGQPVLRRTIYGRDAANALQLATVDGCIYPSRDRAEQFGTRQRESRFPDWAAAADSAWAQLLFQFPGRPRQPAMVSDYEHRCLDEALSIAHTHLSHWNPFIQFEGVPNEAHLGFTLRGYGVEHGKLVFQRPDIWMLRWKAPSRAVYESWSVVLPEPEASGDAAHADRAS